MTTWESTPLTGTTNGVGPPRGQLPFLNIEGEGLPDSTLLGHSENHMNREKTLAVHRKNPEDSTKTSI